MANERKVSGPTLIEQVLSESLGGPRKRAFLAKMQEAVPWEALAKPVRELYRNDTGKGGRPNVSAVVMLKCLLVQKWFGYSDPQLEEALLDSIAIREFVGPPEYWAGATRSWMRRRRWSSVGVCVRRV